MRLRVSPVFLATSLPMGTFALNAHAEELYVPNQFATIQAAIREHHGSQSRLLLQHRHFTQSSP
jgi:hypothetical protein